MRENADQAAFWGGDAGQKWVTQQALLDAQMRPVLDGVIARAGLTEGQHVLDVGCGTGQSALVAAKIVGKTGHVLGVDISPPMLDLAVARAKSFPQAAFVRADAATYDFPAAQFDRVISRFGMMFFADPVAAFMNIAKAIKPGGEMIFATWGQIDRNPWFTLPARIAKAEIGPIPKSDPDEPGPFALRNIAKVENILRDAGLRNVAGVAVDVGMHLPGGATEMAKLVRHIGSAALTVAHYGSDDTTVDILEQKIAAGFAEFPGEIVPAEINFFTATR